MNNKDEQLIYKFLGIKQWNSECGVSFNIWTKDADEWDWNSIMTVVEKIEEITDTKFKISSVVNFSWWYDGRRKKQERFGLFGKMYITLSYYPYADFEIEKYATIAENKKEATLKCCLAFIKWYNNNVKK